jgi:WD40 repeat protein
MALVTAASAQQVGSVLQTNLSSLNQARLIDFKMKGASALSFCSPSRDLFVAFAQEGSRSVHCWNVDTGKKVASYSVPRGYRCDDSLPSPDGKLLLIVGYDLIHDALHQAFKVILFDVQTTKVIKELDYPDNTTFVQFSRDGNCFRVCQGFPSRSPDWPVYVYDRKGNILAGVVSTAFAPAESSFLKQGDKDPSLYYTKDGTQHKLVEEAFDYLSADGDAFLASSTLNGEVVVWRASDLKQIFRAKFGKHPIWVRFDNKLNRFFAINGNKDENASLWAI